MTTTTVPAPQADALRQTQQAFVSAVLPRVEAHGRVCFRDVRCRHQREELLAEMAALCWKWFLRLARRGQDALPFVSVLAAYAARHARAGRRLCGQGSKDALSPLAQQRRGFAVQALPRCDSGTAENLTLDALADNARTPPDEQAAFRIDFPRWLASLAPRKRRVAEGLLAGERACDVAAAHSLSPARISQLRTELLRDWRHFCGEPVVA
jgi:hypothetical protein